MKIRIITIGFCLLVTAAGNAAPARAADAPLTPAEVAARAAEYSLASQLAASDTLAAAADVRHARATWYPTVDFRGQYTTRDKQPEIAAGPLTFSMGNQSNGEYQLTARELLWNGGQRSLAVAAARQNLDAARTRGLSRIQAAQLEALERYVTAMNLKDQDAVLAMTLASLDKRLHEVQDMFDQGLVARNDVLETQVRRDRTRDARAAVRDRLALVLQDLNRALGRDPATPVALPDTLTVADTPQDTSSTVGNNLQVRAAEAAASTSRTLADLSRRAWYPDVFVAATHSWQESDALVHTYVNALALGVSWNIFDGGSRSARTAKAAAGVLAADRSRTEAERAARIALEQARLERSRARREEETARANVAAALENLRIVDDQYREGVARAGDVLDAEALLADSRLQVIIKHHEDFLAGTRLAAARGRDLADYFHESGPSAQGSNAP